MNTDKTIIDRLDDLLALGEKVINTSYYPDGIITTDNYVDNQLASQWKTSVQSFLCQVFGLESEHYKNFTQEFRTGIRHSPVKRGQGVLMSAKDDYVNGYPLNLRKLIQAELFDDFLEQAQYLNESGFIGPSAVIAGTVLEDSLKRLCAKNNIKLPEKPKIESMNAELAKSGVYTVLIQKKITFLADLRNRAAHGKWDSFTKMDVAEMISSTRRFLEEFLS